MKQKLAPRHLLSLLPSLWQKPSAKRSPLGWAEAVRFKTFRTQTFPHLEAIYSDAHCLMGCSEDAADLVVETYVRAFRHYRQFRRRYIPKRLRTQSTLTWLYGKMHGAFCDEVLARAGYGESLDSRSLIGGRP